MDEQSWGEQNRHRVSRLAAAAKLIGCGLVALLLLIPLAWVSGLVQERLGRWNEAHAEITSTWSGPQTIAGPVLEVPLRFSDERRLADGTVEVVVSERSAYFLPREVSWRGSVVPEVRSRGIFEVAVFEAELEAEVRFRRPDPLSLARRPVEVVWDRARLMIGVGETRGIGGGLRIEAGERELAVVPGGIGGSGPLARGVHAVIPGLGDSTADDLDPIKVRLRLRGADVLQFLPGAEETTVELASSWSTPSFSGAFLPAERTVGGSGFEARWAVPWYATSIEPAWIENGAEPAGALAPLGFGVRLALPAGAYHQVERAGKYGILFLLFTFAAFFVAEIRSPRRLHPVHYGLVGAALVVFYLLLLALSEHLGLGLAYALSAGGVVLLIGGYCAAILDRGRAAALATGIAGLYGFLWVALASEDHALLFGSIGVFLALAGLMWATRRIEWSTVG
jgi:inner membrane protein